MTETDTAQADRRTIRSAVVAVLALTGAAAATLPLIARFRLQYISLFYEQFAAIEPVALGLIALFCDRRAAVPVQGAGGRASATTQKCGRWLLGLSAGTILIAIGVFLVAVIGTDVVFHRFFLADDEYAALVPGH